MNNSQYLFDRMYIIHINNITTYDKIYMILSIEKNIERMEIYNKILLIKILYVSSFIKHFAQELFLFNIIEYGNKF